MKSIFKPFLGKFVLVFFDDIIIYRKSWEEHVKHVEMVLQLLKEKQLYVKPSKCFFGVKEVEYLGHTISHEGVLLAWGIQFLTNILPHGLILGALNFLKFRWIYYTYWGGVGEFKV